MPIYNEEDYLTECLNSVLGQTLKEIEIICIDDGSTDKSADILNEFAERDQRIRIITQENKGAGAARNAGMSVAVGEYFSFLDSDDLFDAYMLEKAYDRAKEYACDIVSFGSCRYDEITKSKRPAIAGKMKAEFLPDKTVFSYKDVKQDFFGTFYSWAWDKIFRASFVRENNMYFQNLRSINDLFFVCCALVKAKRISVLKDEFVVKRVNNLNAITTNYSKSYNYNCFYEALMALKKQMMKWNIYEIFERDFINYALQFVIRALDNFKETMIYEELYELLKGEWLKKLGISGHQQEYFYSRSDFQKMCDIEQMTCAEYKIENEICIMSGKYLFPFELIDKNSLIVLYGAGEVGKTYYKQIDFSHYCKIAMWCDKSCSHYKNINIKHPKDIKTARFDKIVIAVNAKKVAREIEQELQELGVDKKYIIWRNPLVGI